MSSSLRYLRVTSDLLDGTLALTTALSPQANARNQPYSWVVQENRVGRISPKQWLSNGSLGAIVIAKCWRDSPDGPVVLASRSATDAELAELKPPANIPDVPPAADLDELLESRNVTNDAWSTPLLLSPEHAITLAQPGDGEGQFAGNTVELMFIDVDNANMMTYVNGVLAAATVDDTVTVRTVTEDVTIAAFSGTQYLLVNATDPDLVVTLPSVADVVEGTTLIVTRIGGDFASIDAAGVETINGSTQPIFLADQGQVTFTRRGGVWLASDAPILTMVTVTNAVADATVALPVSNGSVLVSAVYTERGTMSLPSIITVGPDVEYIIMRSTAGDSATNPRAVRVIPFAGDTLNGVQNNVLALGSPGSVLRLRSSYTGAAYVWNVVSDRQSTQTQALSFAVDTTLNSGWIGKKLIRGTQAAVQTLTLPVTATLFIGTKITATYIGDGGAGAQVGLLIALSAGQTLIVGGASITGAGTLRLCRNETGTFTWDGTNWIGEISKIVTQTIAGSTNALTTFTEGWNGLRIVRCTQVAAQTLLLPAPALCPIGMEVQVVSVGAGGVTINGNGANIMSAGAIAGTLAKAVNVPTRIIFDGTDWSATE